MKIWLAGIQGLLPPENFRLAFSQLPDQNFFVVIFNSGLDLPTQNREDPKIDTIAGNVVRSKAQLTAHP